MSCIYSDNEGVCYFFDESIEDGCCNNEGYCLVEEDENPSESCENYESLEGFTY